MIKLHLYHHENGQWGGIEFVTDSRYAWIGRNGMGLGSKRYGIQNSHWYDLRHPWQRYLTGETRFAAFWSQLRRGLGSFVKG